jgi:hypothetical protein
MTTTTKRKATQRKSYRSPKGKLLNFFEDSRDGWKGKCRAAKRRGKSLYNQVVGLKANRDHWKQQARQYRQELQRLQQQVAEQKARPL